uniref:sensor histidine kinase n=1 Tax=uncultured Pelagibacterium sp. TaxID=1159875 RepID=UPI0030D8804A
PAMLWMGDEEGRCLFLNSALRTFWGVDPEKLDEFDWSSTLHPDDVELLQKPFINAMRDQAPFAVEARYRRADGIYRIMRTQANPRFDSAGKFLGMTGLNTDVTDQRIAEEQSRYLMGELNHRTKNLLTVIQAIARSTARTTSPEAFLDAFGARLGGLAASNDLLVSKAWAFVLIKDLVAGQLQTIGAERDSRVTVGGPEILVCPQHAQMIGMALHELATNSLKHGALCQQAASLRVEWSGHPESGWHIEWDETLPEPIAPPTHRGFGQVVMVDMVERAIQGSVGLTFRPNGILWRLTVDGSHGLTQVDS